MFWDSCYVVRRVLLFIGILVGAFSGVHGCCPVLDLNWLMIYYFTFSYSSARFFLSLDISIYLIGYETYIS